MLRQVQVSRKVSQVVMILLVIQRARVPRQAPQQVQVSLQVLRRVLVSHRVSQTVTILPVNQGVQVSQQVLR